MPEPLPRTIYAVSELAGSLRDLIEGSFPRVWVQGEISNLSRPASGHWYFTLKDEQAQLRAAMFRNANLRVRPPPQNGDQVLVRAQLSLYPARGDLQLICEHLEPAGEGALLRAYETLKRQLAAEGWFDEAAKRPIPAVPCAIGLITSATGAAVQDVLTTLERRFPLAPVHLWPVPVQGEAAAPAIARALRELPGRAPVDVVLLVRGGGSLEDLWAFNEAAVVHAIRECPVPVISGVGHETDTTLADYAADLRAPTPTAAAERATPDIAQWHQSLARLTTGLARPLQRRLRDDTQRQNQLLQRLERQHPARRLREAEQRLDDASQRLRQLTAVQLRRSAQHLALLDARLRAWAPQQRLTLQAARLAALTRRLETAMQHRQRLAEARWERVQGQLQSLSPLAVLGRGYALVRDGEGRLVKRILDVQPGAVLQLTLADGRVETVVSAVEPMKRVPSQG